ncbi:MAG: right-handed parallel beta-helix repeat-containing protein [Acidobacteriaceae bacterium]|nr:right-handed parallel beta-helix repeat-containing protein [Acidobacteriaceae bacterium]
MIGGASALTMTWHCMSGEAFMWKHVFLVAVLGASIPSFAQARTYFIDSVHGDDHAAGTDRHHPWRSLDKVNEQQFHAGDHILFLAGDVWSGQLRVQNSGSPSMPIVFGQYGKGKKPKIDGAGLVEDGVLLRNVEEVEVRNFEITNHGEKPSPRRGVHLVLDNFGVAHHITLSDLYIHDVNGTNDAKDNGGIIFRTLGEAKPSRFDDLRIERNIVWRVDRSGIAADSYFANREHWFPSTHVVLRDNYVSDVGGDGIVPWATDRVLVEHNVVLYANSRADSYNAGIWPWSADNSVFQLNEAAHTQNTKDGEGFDSDYNSRNTLFQYNFSHENEGGFMLICTPGNRNPLENIGNTGTVVRMNVSWMDHNRLVNLNGADDVTVADNVFYVGPQQTVQALLVSNWEGWSKNAAFTRNRFYIEGSVSYGHEVNRDQHGLYTIASGWGPAQDIRFFGNRYFGKGAIAPNSEEFVNHAEAAPELPGSEPTFDPSHPECFSDFLKQHRIWMIGMLEKVLQTKVRLANAAS